MTRITARACDHCGTLGTPVADNARRLPTGWLYVTTSKADSAEVCGWRCLADKANVNAIITASEDRDTP